MASTASIVRGGGRGERRALPHAPPCQPSAPGPPPRRGRLRPHPRPARPRPLPPAAGAAGPPRRASPSPWPGRDRSAEVRARSADGGGRPAAGCNLPRIPSARQARSGRGGPASRLAGGRAWAGPGQRGTAERRGSRGGGREAIRERRDLGQVSRRDPGSKESSFSSPKEGRRGDPGGAGDGEGRGRERPLSCRAAGDDGQVDGRTDG